MSLHLNVEREIGRLGKTGLLRGDVAPLLDDRLLDLPGVGPGPGADLLGDVNALLGGLKLGHQFCDVLAGPLGLQGALLLGGVLDDGLDIVATHLPSLLEPTAGGGAELPGLLGAAGDGGVLLHALLAHPANLLGPLGAVGCGGVSGGVVLALLLDNGLTIDNIVLDVVNLLLGPALGLVLGPADLGALNVAVLDEGCAAHGGSLVESDLLILDETVLPEVLLALLLLLGLVLGDVGGVAPPVVRVVALHHIVVLRLLDHLDLVDTPLAIVPGPGSSNSSKVHRGVVSSPLPLVPGSNVGERATGRFLVVTSTVVATAVVPSPLVGVEREGVGQRTL